MNNLSTSQLSGSAHNGVPTSEELQFLPSASEDFQQHVIDRLLRAPANCKAPSVWRVESPHLRFYSFSTFMDDAPEETWQYQLRAQYLRAELDRLWSSKQGAPVERHIAYSNALVQIYEQPDVGIRSNLLNSLWPQELNSQISGSAGLHWFAADLLRAIRVAQPIYTELGLNEAQRVNKLLLRQIGRSLTQVAKDQRGPARYFIEDLAGLIEEESREA